VDEADRGRLKPDMTARVTSDSLPGVEFAAKLVAFSTLARPDYTTWPPPRNFDVNIEFDKEDDRIRPGMSATIRVAVDRLEKTLLVPTGAVIQKDGQAVVYVAGRDGFEARPVTIARRSQEQVAIASGVKAGERVALRDPTRPDEAAAGGSAAPPIPAGAGGTR
jgi:hypothetical protein